VSPALRHCRRARGSRWGRPHYLGGGAAAGL